MIPANIPINRIPKLKSFRRRVYYIYRGSGFSPFAFLINLRNIKRLKLNCVCETKDGGVRICLSPEAHYSIISTNWISNFFGSRYRSRISFLPENSRVEERNSRGEAIRSGGFAVSGLPSFFRRLFRPLRIFAQIRRSGILIWGW